jgi:aldehyde dehydrogenase (NAD+)
MNDFKDKEEVIRRANGTEFGLSGAVFSQDIDKTMQVASKIHSGTVCINCTIQNQTRVPFGGVKSNGWGRENGKAGIIAYPEPKTTFLRIQ